MDDVRRIKLILMFSGRTRPADNGSCHQWRSTKNLTFPMNRWPVPFTEAAWQLANDRPVPRGHQVQSTCETPRCVSHLVLVKLLPLTDEEAAEVHTANRESIRALGAWLDTELTALAAPVELSFPGK